MASTHLNTDLEEGEILDGSDDAPEETTLEDISSGEEIEFPSKYDAGTAAMIVQRQEFKLHADKSPPIIVLDDISSDEDIIGPALPPNFSLRVKESSKKLDGHEKNTLHADHPSRHEKENRSGNRRKCHRKRALASRKHKKSSRSRSKSREKGSHLNTKAVHHLKGRSSYKSPSWKKEHVFTNKKGVKTWRGHNYHGNGRRSRRVSDVVPRTSRTASITKPMVTVPVPETSLKKRLKTMLGSAISIDEPEDQAVDETKQHDNNARIQKQAQELTSKTKGVERKSLNIASLVMEEGNWVRPSVSKVKKCRKKVVIFTSPKDSHSNNIPTNSSNVEQQGSSSSAGGKSQLEEWDGEEDPSLAELRQVALSRRRDRSKAAEERNILAELQQKQTDEAELQQKQTDEAELQQKQTDEAELQQKQTDEAELQQKQTDEAEEEDPSLAELRQMALRGKRKQCEEDDDEERLAELRRVALMSNAKKQASPPPASDAGDNEQHLTELRLQALRSAVMKRHSVRKRKRLGLPGTLNGSSSLLMIPPKHQDADNDEDILALVCDEVIVPRKVGTFPTESHPNSDISCQDKTIDVVDMDVSNSDGEEVPTPNTVFNPINSYVPENWEPLDEESDQQSVFDSHNPTIGIHSSPALSQRSSSVNVAMFPSPSIPQHSIASSVAIVGSSPLRSQYDSTDEIHQPHVEPFSNVMAPGVMGSDQPQFYSVPGYPPQENFTAPPVFSLRNAMHDSSELFPREEVNIPTCSTPLLFPDGASGSFLHEEPSSLLVGFGPPNAVPLNTGQTVVKQKTLGKSAVMPANLPQFCWDHVIDTNKLVNGVPSEHCVESWPQTHPVNVDRSVKKRRVSRPLPVRNKVQPPVRTKVQLQPFVEGKKVSVKRNSFSIEPVLKSSLETVKLSSNKLIASSSNVQYKTNKWSAKYSSVQNSNTLSYSRSLKWQKQKSLPVAVHTPLASKSLVQPPRPAQSHFKVVNRPVQKKEAVAVPTDKAISRFIINLGEDSDSDEGPSPKQVRLPSVVTSLGPTSHGVPKEVPPSSANSATNMLKMSLDGPGMSSPKKLVVTNPKLVSSTTGRQNRNGIVSGRPAVVVNQKQLSLRNSVSSLAHLVEKKTAELKLAPLQTPTVGRRAGVGEAGAVSNSKTGIVQGLPRSKVLVTTLQAPKGSIVKDSALRKTNQSSCGNMAQQVGSDSGAAQVGSVNAKSAALGKRNEVLGPEFGQRVDHFLQMARKRVEEQQAREVALRKQRALTPSEKGAASRPQADTKSDGQVATRVPSPRAESTGQLAEGAVGTGGQEPPRRQLQVEKTPALAALRADARVAEQLRLSAARDVPRAEGAVSRTDDKSVGEPACGDGEWSNVQDRTESCALRVQPVKSNQSPTLLSSGEPRLSPRKDDLGEVPTGSSTLSNEISQPIVHSEDTSRQLSTSVDTLVDCPAPASEPVDDRLAQPNPLSVPAINRLTKAGIVPKPLVEHLVRTGVSPKPVGSALNRSQSAETVLPEDLGCGGGGETLGTSCEVKENNAWTSAIIGGMKTTASLKEFMTTELERQRQFQAELDRLEARRELARLCLEGQRDFVARLAGDPELGSRLSGSCEGSSDRPDVCCRLRLCSRATMQGSDAAAQDEAACGPETSRDRMPFSSSWLRELEESLQRVAEHLCRPTPKVTRPYRVTTVMTDNMDRTHRKPSRFVKYHSPLTTVTDPDCHSVMCPFVFESRCQYTACKLKHESAS